MGRRAALAAALAVAAILGGGAAVQAAPIEEKRGELTRLKGEGFHPGDGTPEGDRMAELAAEIHRLVDEDVDAAPPGNGCAAPIPIACGSSVQASNRGATTGSIRSCARGGSEVFYTFLGNGGSVTIDTCSFADFDTALRVSPGDCATGEVACDDDSCGDSGLQSSVTFASTPGDVYAVALGGFAGLQGTATLTVRCEVAVELERFGVASTSAH